MRSDRVRVLLGCAICWGAVVARPAPTVGQDAASARPKKVLVELYSSQGCNSCPPASDLVGKLADGPGGERLVVLNFHVDYFNRPWADPFSDPRFSDRQQSYNRVLRRDDLYFTPLLMVDGRVPMLGSNRERAVPALRQAKAEAPGVDLAARLEGPPTGRHLAVRVAARGAAAAGRELLVGVAVTQDRAATAVPSGENAGRTLVEHHVVRRFDHRMLRLDRASPTALDFPVELPPDADPAGYHVAVFAQDRDNGRVYQAESLPWLDAAPGSPTAGR